MFHSLPENLSMWTLTVLLIVTAFLFWQYGAQKLFCWFESGPVEFLGLLWFAGILEFFGPFCIGFGLFTRPVAFLLAGEMAVAYFIGHFPRGFWPVANRGDRAVLFCFIYLLLVTTGPGKLALDNLLFKKSAKKRCRMLTGRAKRVSPHYSKSREKGRSSVGGKPTRKLPLQRSFQMAAGYGDCNDADWLRLDPILKTPGPVLKLALL